MIDIRWHFAVVHQIGHVAHQYHIHPHPRHSAKSKVTTDDGSLTGRCEAVIIIPENPWRCREDASFLSNPWTCATSNPSSFFTMSGCLSFRSGGFDDLFDSKLINKRQIINPSSAVMVGEKYFSKKITCQVVCCFPILMWKSGHWSQKSRKRVKIAIKNFKTRCSEEKFFWQDGIFALQSRHVYQIKPQTVDGETWNTVPVHRIETFLTIQK